MTYDFLEEKEMAAKKKAEYEAFAERKKNEGNYMLAADYYLATGRLDEALDCYEQHIREHGKKDVDNVKRIDFYPILEKSIKDGNDTDEHRKKFMEYLMENNRNEMAEVVSKADPELVLYKLHDYLKEMKELERGGKTENAAELAKKKGDIERAIKNYAKVLPDIIEARLSNSDSMAEAIDLKNYKPAPRKDGETIDDKINELMKEMPGTDKYRDRAEIMREEGRKDVLVKKGKELEKDGKPNAAARHYVAAGKDDMAISLLEKTALERDTNEGEGLRAYVDAVWLNNRSGNNGKSAALRKKVEEKEGMTKAALAIMIPIAISLALVGKNLFSNSTGYAISGIPLFSMEYVIIFIAGIAAFFIIATNSRGKNASKAVEVKFFYK